LVISASVGASPSSIGGSFIFEEVAQLSRIGIDIHVIRPTNEPDFLSHGIQFHGIGKGIAPQALGQTMKNLNTFPLTSLVRKPLSIWRYNLYAQAVTLLTEKAGIDLLHAHFSYPEGLVGMLSKKRTGKPLVVTVHGADILVERSANYGMRLDKGTDVIIRRVLSVADAVITASTATYREARRLVGSDRTVHLIPNGVDVVRFHPSLDGGNIRDRMRIQDKVVVFSLRSHEPRYGLEYLVRAAPIVAGRIDDVVFVIGGDGSLRRYHETLARCLGVADRVIFPGSIPREQVPHYYAMSDIVVIPSVQEAFGLSVTEAMACGKPVIGTSVGGIPDQITHGRNGLLVPPKDTGQLASAIIRLASDPALRRSMGAEGRRIVENRFDIRKRIAAISALYASLI